MSQTVTLNETEISVDDLRTALERLDTDNADIQQAGNVFVADSGHEHVTVYHTACGDISQASFVGEHTKKYLKEMVEETTTTPTITVADNIGSTRTFDLSEPFAIIPVDDWSITCPYLTVGTGTDPDRTHPMLGRKTRDTEAAGLDPSLFEGGWYTASIESIDL